MIDNSPPTIFNKKTVHVSFEFLTIGEINTLEETFEASVNIECRWTMDDLTEDEFDARIHWNPQLYIDNAINIKDNVSYEVIRENGLSLVTERREVKGKFFTAFPMYYNIPFFLIFILFIQLKALFGNGLISNM
jgi:hypothetical protein